MATTPEGKVKAKLNRRLKPYVDSQQVHKLMPVQTGFGAVGLDYHLCAGGHYVAIETKARAGLGLTKLQLATQEHIEQAGGHVLIVYDDASVDHAIRIIEFYIANEALRKKFAA